MKILKKLGHEDSDTSLEWLLGRKILKNTADQLKNKGIPAALVLIPPQRWITGTDEPLRQSLIRFGKREDIEVIDLTPVFQEASAKDGVDHYYIPDDFHWTPAGHSLTAHILTDYLKKKIPLKKRSY
jgi:lysophospholipase L1-like esterase